MEPLDIYFGVAGQSIHYDCPEGRPTGTPTIEVFAYDVDDDGEAESATTGSVTVGNPEAQLITGPAGPSQSDPFSLPIPEAGLATGQPYLISEDGVREWIEFVKLGENPSLRYSLANDFTVLAQVDSVRISVSLEDTWVADEDNLFGMTGAPHYRVRWTYVVDGVTRVRDSYFNLLRYAGDYEVTAEMVDDYSPGFRSSIDRNHQVDAGARMIRQAAREVASDLREVDIDDAALRDPELHNQLIVRKVVEIWKRGQLNSGSGDPTALELAMEKYQGFLDRHFTMGDSAVVGGRDGASENRIAHNLLLK